MVAFLILLLIVIPLSVRWVRGTDYQKLDLFDDEDKNMFQANIFMIKLRRYSLGAFEYVSYAFR